jgi:hypothetical protein
MKEFQNYGVILVHKKNNKSQIHLSLKEMDLLLQSKEFHPLKKRNN